MPYIFVFDNSDYRNSKQLCVEKVSKLLLCLHAMLLEAKTALIFIIQDKTMDNLPFPNAFPDTWYTNVLINFNY